MVGLRAVLDDEEGKLLSVDEITALSKIAPREELLARLAGGMAAPMQQFAALLNAVTSKFAYAIQALIEAGGAPGAPESAPAAAEAEPESETSAEADSTADTTQTEESETSAQADVETASAQADEEGES